MRRLIREIYKNDYGQGLVEYSLIISLVVLVVIATLEAFGGKVRDYYIYIESKIP